MIDFCVFEDWKGLIRIRISPCWTIVAVSTSAPRSIGHELWLIISNLTMGKKRPAKEEAEEVDDAGEEGMADVGQVEDNSTDSLHWTRETVVPLPLDGPGKNLKIISWNVNGLKALVSTKLQVLTSLVGTHSPDIICFQVSCNAARVLLPSCYASSPLKYL